MLQTVCRVGFLESVLKANQEEEFVNHSIRKQRKNLRLFMKVKVVNRYIQEERLVLSIHLAI